MVQTKGTVQEFFERAEGFRYNPWFRGSGVEFDDIVQESVLKILGHIERKRKPLVWTDGTIRLFLYRTMVEILRKKKCMTLSMDVEISSDGDSFSDFAEATNSEISPEFLYKYLARVQEVKEQGYEAQAKRLMAILEGVMQGYEPKDIDKSADYILRRWLTAEAIA